MNAHPSHLSHAPVRLTTALHSEQRSTSQWTISFANVLERRVRLGVASRGSVACCVSAVFFQMPLTYPTRTRPIRQCESTE